MLFHAVAVITLTCLSVIHAGYIQIKKDYSIADFMNLDMGNAVSYPPGKPSGQSTTRPVPAIIPNTSYRKPPRQQRHRYTASNNPFSSSSSSFMDTPDTFQTYLQPGPSSPAETQEQAIQKCVDQAKEILKDLIRGGLKNVPPMFVFGRSAYDGCHGAATHSLSHQQDPSSEICFNVCIDASSTYWCNIGCHAYLHSTHNANAFV